MISSTQRLRSEHIKNDIRVGQPRATGNEITLLLCLTYLTVLLGYIYKLNDLQVKRLNDEQIN